MILSCIDTLAKMIQNATDSRSDEEIKNAHYKELHAEAKKKHGHIVDDTLSKIKDHREIKQAISKMPKEKQDRWTNHPKYGDLRQFENFNKAMQDIKTLY